MNTTSLSLLQRLQQPGDQAAWERFVKLYTPLLCHWARKLGLEGPDVADLVQEVCTILVRQMPTFRYEPTKRFRAWLWTLTLNKRRQAWRGRPVPSAIPSEALDALVGRDSLDELDEDEYRHCLVQRALQLMQTHFQPATWKAFWECAVADRPVAEVAAELGLSIDSVYAAKSRVLRRLRQELAGLLD
jgi:RNA polymerase sigma-70 factor (ECF subfamily)